jgi:hypothetical protein
MGQIGRGNLYINRSQTHECGNWDCGRSIPFLETFVANFGYCVFAVLGTGLLLVGNFRIFSSNTNLISKSINEDVPREGSPWVGW